MMALHDATQYNIGWSLQWIELWARHPATQYSTVHDAGTDITLHALPIIIGLLNAHEQVTSISPTHIFLRVWQCSDDVYWKIILVVPYRHSDFDAAGHTVERVGVGRPTVLIVQNIRVHFCVSVAAPIEHIHRCDNLAYMCMFRISRELCDQSH